MPKSSRNGDYLKALIKDLRVDEKLRLRGGVLPRAKIREFLFKGLGQDGKVFLAPESEDYTWEANFDDVDWEEYVNRKTATTKKS